MIQTEYWLISTKAFTNSYPEAQTEVITPLNFAAFVELT